MTLRRRFARPAVLAFLLARASVAGAAADDMVSLPGGTFRAGETTGPHNDVTWHRLRAYQLDRTEVTVAAYAECAGAGKCRPATAAVQWDGLRDKERAKWAALCNGERADRPDHPVNCVDWSQAEAYCAWAGKRLPSEAELEWASRNGKSETAYPWGDDPPADRACWNGEGNGAGKGAREGTCPAGGHPSGDSAAGVKDLAGNVSEWTSSRDVVAADSRGRGGTSVRVARGGSWRETDPRSLTASARLRDLPTRRSPDLGFRCAKSP